MKKLKALLLALVVVAPTAILAPQSQAKTVTSQQLLAANTSTTKVMKKHHGTRLHRRTHNTGMYSKTR